MKIKILKNTVCGGQKVYADDIVDASEKDAAILIGYKKAELVDQAEAPAESTTPAAEAPAEPEQQAEEPAAPAKTTKRKK